MKKELAEQFNQEVETYRRALLYYAKICDWQTFEAKAGRMFDYVESVELRELERRFFNAFNLILGALIMAVIIYFNVDFEAHLEWVRWKNVFLLSAIAACSFELYFYLDYRIYIKVKTTYYRKRRENFIRGLEEDFRNYTPQTVRNAA